MGRGRRHAVVPGQEFGTWTVVEEAATRQVGRHKIRMVQVRCSVCGDEGLRALQDLVEGKRCRSCYQGRRRRDIHVGQRAKAELSSSCLIVKLRR